MKYIGVYKIFVGWEAVLFCIVVPPLAGERCQPRLCVSAGADRAAIIHFARACLEPRAQSVGHPSAKTARRGAPLFFLSMPLLQKHSASCGLHVLSECCKIRGDTFPPLWRGSDAQPKAGTNTKPLAEQPKPPSVHQHLCCSVVQHLCCNNQQ